MNSGISFSYIEGVVELLQQPFIDARGSFLNCFRVHDLNCVEAWQERSVSQVNISRTNSLGTVRGLHLQSGSFAEAKLVRCLRGRVWDVAVDLRLGSETYGQWHGVELTPKRSNAFLIPEGCAHGFQALEDGSELLYLHSGHWVPDAEVGVNCIDDLLGIKWPLPPTCLNARDLKLPKLLGPLQASTSHRINT